MKKFFVFIGLVIVVLISIVSFGLFGGRFLNPASVTVVIEQKPAVKTIPVRLATHVKTPEAVKGIYMTACTASAPSLREKLLNLTNETELNTIVLDIKTYDGWVSYNAKTPSLADAIGGSCHVKDMQDFIDKLHSKNIYVVGRIAAFQDVLRVKQRPDLAVKKESATTTIWKDYKGIPWIDTGSKEQWEYLVTIAKDAYSIGFDEINFDYVRYPADGNMKDIWYPISEGKKKADVLEKFFAYLYDSLGKSGMKLSADLFGMVTTNPDDLNIGQVLERALPYFDYIAPMVYPSHYPNNTFGLGDPNKHPYEIVNRSMSIAVARTIATTTQIFGFAETEIASTSPKLYSKESFDKNKLRPWLQDNNYPVPYTPEMVRAQIKATYDAGLNSWMLWNASNRYTREALLTE